MDAFLTGIPWTWESYREWRDALASLGTAVNVAALVGHSNLRVYVMGDDAWERAATAAERDMLAAVLADSLPPARSACRRRSSTRTATARPVPSRAADDAELVALIDVLASAQGGPRVLEFLPWVKEIDRQLADIERVARWCGARGVACTWNQLAQNSRDPSRAERLLEQAHRLHDEGCRVFAQVSPRPFSLNVSFDATPAFVAIRAWSELIQLAPDEKRRVLVDASWRARPHRLGQGGRWIHHLPGEPTRPGSAHHRALRRRALHRRDPRGADRARRSPVGRVGRLGVRERPRAGDHGRVDLEQRRAGRVAELIADPTTVVGASDAGAHLQMMCGAGDSTLLLTEHVRDRHDLALEAAVHQITGRLADVFGIPDRGIVAPGHAADLVVFALDELSYTPDSFVHDLPGGAPRLTRPPGGFRTTVVAGVVTQQGGVATGARPTGPLVAGA